MRMAFELKVRGAQTKFSPRLVVMSLGWSRFFSLPFPPLLPSPFFFFFLFGWAPLSGST